MLQSASCADASTFHIVLVLSVSRADAVTFSLRVSFRFVCTEVNIMAVISLVVSFKGWVFFTLSLLVIIINELTALIGSGFASAGGSF